MIDSDPPGLSVVRQCELLDVSRSTWYYPLRPLDPEELTLMRLLDEQYLKTPFYASRKMREHLRRWGHVVNRKRMQRLMGLKTIDPKPKTRGAHPTIGSTPTCSGS